MSFVSSPELESIRPVLADAVDLARQALIDLGEGGVGDYLGVTAEDEASATHRFVSDLAGYRGWQWAVVVAAPDGAEKATISELVLLPGPDSLVAPTWLPWDERIRPGDLGPGDLLPPRHQDRRLVPGYVACGDPEVDDVAYRIGLGRTQVSSFDGRLEAAERWHEGEYGPDTEMAKSAPSTCGLCGFYLPIAGSMSAAFGVCVNEYAADGRVVHSEYGCGAHSDTELPTGAGSPQFDPFDDAALDVTGSAPAVSEDSPPTDIPDATPSGADEPVSPAVEGVSDAPSVDDAPSDDAVSHDADSHDADSHDAVSRDASSPDAVSPDAEPVTVDGGSAETEVDGSRPEQDSVSTS